MRVAVAIVDPEGFRKPEHNAARRTWARAAFDHLAAVASAPTVLVLPAGFLAAPSDDVHAVAAPVIADAAEREVEVVLGVDVVAQHGASGKSRGGKAHRAGIASEGRRLGFAAVASAWPDTCHWQRSITGEDGRDLPAAVAQEARTVSIGRARVEVLLCGEVFAPAIREGVRRRAPRIAAVLAHTAHGSRHGHGITRIAHASADSVTVLRAVHAVGDARTSWPSSGETGCYRRDKISDEIWLDVFDFPTNS